MCGKGIVIVFSGNGKGKTSAAIGTVIRMVGWGKKVAYFTFFKKKSCTELKVLKKLKGCRVFTFCEKYPSFSKDLTGKEFKDFFRSEWKKFLAKFNSLKEFHLVVVDEILIAVRDGLIKDTEIIYLLEQARKNNEKVNIILTGRSITDSITNFADVVTEMQCIKHPYPEIRAIKGIDW